jgi:hypothetical protein
MRHVLAPSKCCYGVDNLHNTPPPQDGLRDELVFVLSQALAMFDHYMVHIAHCDAQLERQFSALKPRLEPAAVGLEAVVRQYRLTGESDRASAHCPT